MPELSSLMRTGIGGGTVIAQLIDLGVMDSFADILL